MRTVLVVTPDVHFFILLCFQLETADTERQTYAYVNNFDRRTSVVFCHGQLFFHCCILIFSYSDKSLATTHLFHGCYQADPYQEHRFPEAKS